MTDTAIQERIAKAQPVIAVDPTLKLQLAKRGVDEYGWNTLKQSIFPGAQDASIVMAIDYCKARNLDVLKKPVHIVPIWNSKEKRMVDTIWPSIAEIRTTAMRTGQYAGKDETKFGPMQKQDMGKVKDHRFPEWAQVTVYRMMNGQRVPFVGPRVFWLEAYATAGRDDDSPNQMWADRPMGQLDKCAEAAALRAAFPEELGSDYSVDEIRQYGGMKDVTPNAQSSGASNIGKAMAESYAVPQKNVVPAQEESDEELLDKADQKFYSNGGTAPHSDFGPTDWPEPNSDEGRKLAAELDAEAAKVDTQ